MGIAATCGSPKGFPGGGQVRGGGAAAALTSSTGRGACAFRGSNCLKWGQSGLLSVNRREAKQLVCGCRIRSEQVAG